MPEPVISVVIPTYNSSQFIAKTLDCLVKQTFKNFEVVIVNDGSVDNTETVISEFIASHLNLNIRLIKQDNKGIAGARNRGIIEAKGRYVAFLDHDDIWYSDKLKSCYEIFSKYPEVDLVCHNELMRDGSGKVVRYISYGPYTPNMFKRLLFRGNYLSTSATVVKKDILLSEGVFREYPEFATVEDYDLWIRLAKNHKFYFINEILGEYIINNRNASLDLERHFSNQINILKTNFREYKRRNFVDYVLIKLRISKIYLLIAKDNIRKNQLEKALHYILKATLNPFKII